MIIEPWVFVEARYKRVSVHCSHPESGDNVSIYCGNDRLQVIMACIIVVVVLLSSSSSRSPHFSTMSTIKGMITTSHILLSMQIGDTLYYFV